MPTTAPPIRLDQEVSRALIRLAAMAALAMLIAMVTNVWRTQLYARVANNVAADQAVSQTHLGVAAELGGLTAYLESRDPSFLESYIGGGAAVSHGLAALRPLVENDPSVFGQYRAASLTHEAWETQWAVRAASPLPPPPPVEAFFEQGHKLFTAYQAAETALDASLVSQGVAASSFSTRVANAALVGEGLLFIAGIVFWWRTRRRLRRAVVGPVSTILAEMTRIEGGDYGAPAPAQGPSELRAVSDRLTAMARTLEAAREGVRQRETEAARHAARLREIVDMGREIAGSLNLGYVLQAVSTSVLRVGQFGRCVIWLTAETSGSLIPRHDSAGPKGIVVGLEPVLVGETAIGQAARLVHVVGPQAVSHPNAAQPWSRAVAVPMVVGARVIGVIEIGMDDQQETPPAVMDLVRTISSQAATAIEAARLYEQAEKLGMTDALTLLPNRRDLDRALGDEVERARRYHRPLAVAMIDIDHFKTVNDTEGHSRGDQILQEAAGVMRATLRSVDTIYRYGGEEFLVVMPETDPAAALDLCNRLRVAVAELVTVRSGHTLTISSGVASFPAAGQDPARLITSADEAMYRAKRRGRNRVVAAAGLPVALVATLSRPAQPAGAADAETPGARQRVPEANI